MSRSSKAQAFMTYNSSIPDFIVEATVTAIVLALFIGYSIVFISSES
jgi:hypothetical protein